MEKRHSGVSGIAENIVGGVINDAGLSPMRRAYTEATISFTAPKAYTTGDYR